MKHAAIHSHASHATGIHPLKGFAGGAATRLNQVAAPTQDDQLHTQVQKWVSQTFFGTLLKQMRNSPFKSKLLEGGRGGEAFQSMYDQRLADHMARGAGHKLVDSIVRKIQARKAYAGVAKGKQHANSRPTIQGKGMTNVPTALRA